MYRGRSIRRMGLLCLLALTALVLPAQSALAAGIRVAPSVERVLPGEDFYVDIVAEDIPVDDGLGTVQFRLNVDAPGAKVAGVPDLGQAGTDSVAVATPLLISEPTATRSGLGPFFQSLHQGSEGVLVLDNEPLSGGSALFTYAHTHGANRPSGTGAVARFRVRVGAAVAAERIDFTLTDVLLLDGGPAYPLDSNVGATVTLRCTALVPDLAGKTLTEAQTALSAAGLTAGGTYEIANPDGARPLGVVLEQSAPTSSEVDCETAVNLAINAAPAEVTNLSTADVPGDDTGRATLSWIPSASPDAAGYRVYEGTALLAEVSGGEAAGAEISGLDNGVEQSLRIAAVDTFGNESVGIPFTAKALDDVPPLVTISDIEEGTYYNTPVTPQVEIAETNPAGQTITLNGAPYDLSSIALDGAYVLAVSATDVSGNTTSRSVAFTVDRTAPVITVANVVEGGNYGSDLTPEIAVADVNLDTEGTTYTLDGQAYQIGTAVETERPHTLTVLARDMAGNNSSLTIHFVIDKTAPVVTIAGVIDGGHYNVDLNPTASVTDTYLKNSSITLNGQPFIFGTAITAEGEYVLIASGEDEAGNSAMQTVSFVIDKTAPTLTVEGIADGMHYNVDLTPIASVGDAYLKSGSVTLNGEAFASGSAVTEEGEYVLLLFGEDRAGNNSSLAIHFIIDKTPPVVAISGVADGALYNVDVTPVVTVTDPYLQSSGLTLNGQPFVSGTVIREEGTYALAAQAEDRAGNIADAALDFVIDKTAPTSASSVGAPSYGSGDSFYVAADTDIALSSVDGGVAPTGVDRLEFALDGTGQWDSYAETFTLADLAEGNHTICFRASDKAGNLEEIKTLPLVLDKSAPSTAVSQDGAQFTDAAGTLYITGTTGFALGAADNLSGVARTEYRVDDGDWTAYAPFTLNGLADGIHTVFYRSEDNVANAEVQKSLTATADNTAPVTTISVGERKYAGPDGNLYVTAASEITLAAADNLSGVARTEYRIDGGVWTVYEPFTLAGLLDGIHTIGCRSADNLGNVETEQVLEVVVDNTSPESALSLGDPKYSGNALYVTGATVFTLSASDNLSGVARTEYRIDGGAWTVYVPFSLTDLFEGEHVIEFYAADNVGNAEEAQALTVVVDNTAPATVVAVADPKYEGDPLYITGDTRFTLSATDDLSGVARTEYRIDGGAWTTYAPFTLDGFSDGIHAIGYRSADNVENVGTEKVLEVVVDDSAPESTISMDEPKFGGDALYVAGATAFTLSASDNLSGAAGTEYRIDGGAWTIYASFTLAGMADGDHVIGYRSTDNVGNVEAEQNLNVVLDNTAPVTAITVGDPKYIGGLPYVTGTTGFTLAAADSLSGVARTEYRIDGGEWTAYAPFTLAGLADGDHRIGYRSVDNLGNVEIEQFLAVIVDNTAPVTTISTAEPHYNSDTLYVTGATGFTLAVADNLSGVARTEYRIDGGAWKVYAPFTLAGLTDGPHTIGYRSVDYVENVESEHVLSVVVDNTAPSSTISTGEPQYKGEALYVTGATEFTLAVADELSGVARTEYRIDGGKWTAYAPFTLAELADGEHTIGYRSTDNVANVETEQVLALIVDNTAPATVIDVGEPKFAGDALYVTGATEFTLSPSDNLSGVVRTEYRIDGGAWTAYAPFTLTGLPDGAHTIEFHSVDNVENAEAVKILAVVLDNTPPQTSVSFNHQSYLDGEALLVSRETEITLSASDEISGVADTQYRFDDEAGWHTYYGIFRLADLAYGTHILRYHSIDNVENKEEEKAVTLTLLGVEVETEVLNLPRVLVWTEDPATLAGRQRPAYTFEEVKDLVGEALGVSDIYATMTADRDEFSGLLRSGIYNMAMILNQDVPFDTVFLREMREAVHRGTGLLVSSWGSSVPPLWQDVFGVDFKGSVSMDEKERPLHLFDSSVSADRSLTASGRVLRTALKGGSLAGVLPAESTCEGLRGLTLLYPLGMGVGDRVTVSLALPKGKKTVAVDEEELAVTGLPEAGINRFTGNTAGDLAIGGITEDGITLTLAAPYGYLEGSYILSLTVERADGTTITSGEVAVTPVCAADLQAGMSLAPFEIVAVDEERVKNGDDLPAVVLGEYGQGRTTFLSYNLIESALNGQRSEHLDLLRKAAYWLLPETAQPEAGGVSLLETRIKLLSAGLDLQAVDTLSEGLNHLPLFDLTHASLTYDFHLQEDEQISYRYFVQFADLQGDYSKSTAVLFGLDGGYVPFADYPSGFSIGDDSRTLLLQALAWVDGQLPAHPEAVEALLAIRDELVRISSLPRTTSAESETVIHETVQAIHKALQLGLDSSGLRDPLGQYLRIIEGEGYFN